jgi:hypothetical protein
MSGCLNGSATVLLQNKSQVSATYEAELVLEPVCAFWRRKKVPCAKNQTVIA